MATDRSGDGQGHDANPLVRETGLTGLQWLKLGLAAGLVALCIGFVLANDHRVEARFGVFSVRTQLWLSLFTALVIGTALGLAAGFAWNRRRRRPSIDDL